MPKLDEIDHTADRAFRVRGHDLPELFVRAAEAILEMQGQRNGRTRTGRKGNTTTREVEVEGFDRETLLVNWLNELLYLQETKQETCTTLEILEISDGRLRARLQVQPGRRGRRLIKAVTFHGLQLRPRAKGWEATLVVDV